MAYRRRQGAAPNAEEARERMLKDEFASSYPLLAAFIVEDRFDDATPRDPGTLLICVGDGVVKAWLHDRAEGLSAWLSAPTISELLDLVETGFEGDGIEWRASQGQNGRRPKR